ncbi:MAG: hypothetical protein DIU62_001680 [Pseudomonadota bacterium]|jgi:hypothetical protein
MKDEKTRELLQGMADEELPIPDWRRVSLRARFEDEFERRRAAFRTMPWVQLAVYAIIGIALAVLVAWAVLELSTGNPDPPPSRETIERATVELHPPP